MDNIQEQLHFTTRVLGPVAAFRLERGRISSIAITQTLRSASSIITDSIVQGRVSVGDRLEVLLDSRLVGHAELISMDAIIWEYINLDDAKRGGFDRLADLELALKRAGYRFKPLSQYELFRIQFRWLEEA